MIEFLFHQLPRFTFQKNALQLIFYCINRLMTLAVLLSLYIFSYVPKPRIFISELSPDGAARIFPNSYAAAKNRDGHYQLVELHHTRTFEGRYAD